MNRTLLSVLLLGALSAVPATLAAQESRFRVVVHRSNPTASLTAAQASALFLKKAGWPHGVPVQPVDLTEDSPIRKAFTSAVHGRPVSAVKAYWQQKVFSGRDVQPPEEPGDGAVLAYVRANPGAIGYVSDAAAVGGDVKVLPFNN